MAYSLSQADPLTELWHQLVESFAGATRFDVVRGISKAQLVAMSDSISMASSMSEPLDYHLARVIESEDIDRAVVAWDLHPKWNSHETRCRWQETLDLYAGLANSEVLPEAWVHSASIRLEEMQSRPQASARPSPPVLDAFSVLPLCMDSMFETLLCDESLMREALGVRGVRVKAWPSGWSQNVRDPDKSLIGPAISAVRRQFPKSAPCKAVRRDWRSGKNDWALHIIRQIAQSTELRERVSGHPIIERLAEIAPAQG